MTELKPAWYSSNGNGRLSDFISLLHLPYTIWHLSYILIGIGMSPVIYPERSTAVLFAYFFGLGIGAHALDETMGNPLQTRLSKKSLYLVGFGALTIAVAIGLYYTFTLSLLILPFVLAESFFAVAYNLEIFDKRFHSMFVFALSWGSIPFLTGYFVNSLTISLPVVLMAVAVGLLTFVQRTLSSQARNWRRKIDPIKSIRFSSGKEIPMTSGEMISPAENSLKALTAAILLLSIALIIARVV